MTLHADTTPLLVELAMKAFDGFPCLHTKAKLHLLRSPMVPAQTNLCDTEEAGRIDEVA